MPAVVGLSVKLVNPTSRDLGNLNHHPIEVAQIQVGEMTDIC